MQNKAQFTCSNDIDRKVFNNKYKTSNKVECILKMQDFNGDIYFSMSHLIK